MGIFTFKRVVILLLFFVLGILLVVSAGVFLDKHNLVQVSEMPVFVTASPDWGYFPDYFNDTNNLNFSQMVFGQRFGRTVDVVNPFDFPVNVKFKIDGSIREFFYAEVSSIALAPNETRPVSFFLQIPAVGPDEAAEKMGDYDGTLHFMFYKT